VNNKDQLNKHGIHIKKGDHLNGKYRVLSHISSGGMSEVYLIEDMTNPENRWAIKVTKKSHPLSQSLYNETNILSELDHPSLPYVVDSFSTEDYYFLVMEYIDGVALSDLFDIHNQQFPLDLIIHIGKQVSDVIAFLHTREPHPIIYRDLKPGNILIKSDHTVKLIDFGTAKKFERNQLFDTARIGTVGFAAPEQFEKKQTDERTDLFSLGALLYYLLSKGKYVYAADKPIREFHSTLPKSLEKCVTKLVETKTEERIQTIGEVRLLLEKAEKEIEKPKLTANQLGFLSIISVIFFSLLSLFR